MMICSNKKSLRAITLATLAVHLLCSNIARAKTIRFKNATENEKFFVYFPHFTSSTTIDRWPVIDQFNLGPGESKEIYVKPYQYNSHIYLPNIDWIDDANDSTDEAKRKERITQEFSYGGPDAKKWDERHSIKIVPQGGLGYHRIRTTDKEIGKIIQAMAETPEDNPQDGFFIKRDTPQDSLQLHVQGGGEWEYYEDED